MTNSRQMVRLVATARFLDKAGRPIRVNDELELPEDEAKELIAVGFAAPPPSVSVTDAVTAPGDAKTKQRTYRRRDMEAEK